MSGEGYRFCDADFAATNWPINELQNEVGGGGACRGEGVFSLCHFSNAVHVESRNLLRHHAAHGQLQLQQRCSKTVVLAKKG